MYTRKTALALAIQARTCPPQHILEDPAHARDNIRHQAVCPFCSTRRSEELDAGRNLGRFLEKQIPPVPRPLRIQPGQIWQIDPSLAGWRDRYYYSSPAVMVVKPPEPDFPGLLAAQIWHDLYLAGPGDLVVTPEDSPLDEPVFIETWNLYTLDPAHLTRYLYRTPTGTTADILKMNENPDYLPDHAMILLPLQENDPRHYFRKMEIETGYTFARAAAENLIQTLAGRLVTDLKKQIQRMISGATFSWPPRTAEECFALLEFPPESLALAAADDDHEKIVATHFHLTPDPEQNLVTRITPFYCVIFNAAATEDGFDVFGTLADMQFDLKKTAFSCYLADRTAQTLEKGTIQVEPETHVFVAQFARPKKPSESLCILAEETQEPDHPK
ncbi:MAG: hypothetical protein RQ739_10480 [Desulfotignum sp.]|nr:hypothetical protein [Desulfotignum sp.]